MVVLTASLRARLEKWAAPEPASGCFIWTGALANGYACLRINKKTTKVTRLLMQAKLGRALSPDEHVLHQCDVACCVNPNHLRVGTHKENMAEVWERRRPRRKGEGVGKAKLTYAQVAAIRASAEPHRVLAERYGVVKSTISFAKRGLTWSY